VELPITNQRASYFEGSDQFSIFVSKGDTSHFDFLVLKNFIKAVNFCLKSLYYEFIHRFRVLAILERLLIVGILTIANV